MSQGVKSIILATLLFAFMNVFVKLLPGIPAIEIVFFRSLFTLVACYIAIRRKGLPLLGSRNPVLWLRGIFGSISLIFFFKSVLMLPLATATLIHYITPFFTTLFGYYFLKEKFYRIQWLFLLICFAGIVTAQSSKITPATFFSTENAGLFFGLGATLAAAAAYNTIRKIGISEDPNVILFYFPLVSIPVTLALLLVQGGFVVPDLKQVFYLLCMGALTQAAQYYMTTAYQSEKVGSIAIFTNVGIVYAVINGVLFFNEVPDGRAWLGMFIVITGILLNIFREKILRFFAPPKTV